MRRGICTIMSVLVLGCGATQDQVITRASFDLRCPEEQLEVVELDSQTSGVRGCGQQVTYVEMCNAPFGSPHRECTWVLNSNSRPAHGAPVYQSGPPVMQPPPPVMQPPPPVMQPPPPTQHVPR